MKRRAGGSSNRRSSTCGEWESPGILSTKRSCSRRLTCWLGDAEAVRQRCTTFLHASEQLAKEETVTAAMLLAWAEGALGQWDQAGRSTRLRARIRQTTVSDGCAAHTGTARHLAGTLGRGYRAGRGAGERTRAMPYPYAEAKTLWVYGRLEAARGNRAAARVLQAGAGDLRPARRGPLPQAHRVRSASSGTERVTAYR